MFPEFLEIAKIAAIKSGRIILEYFNKDLVFEEKKDKTFVSIADKESEEIIKKTILDKFPKHSIIGEETGKSDNSREFIWHIDPLDGTSNFKNKIPYCCVSIGLENNGKFILGVIYNPFLDELYHAEEGNGAYLNEKRIHVNNQLLSEGIIVIDSSFSGKRAEIKSVMLKDLTRLTSRFRMTGSNALQLAELSKGSYYASISDHLNSYDFIAGLVIAKEAGAIVTDQYGKSPSTNSKVIIASNNKVNHEILISLA